MWAPFVSFIKALPDLVGLFKDLVGAIKGLVEAYKFAQTEKWVNHGKELAHQIAVAKTDAERAELVKKLRDSWNNLPS